MHKFYGLFQSHSAAVCQLTVYVLLVGGLISWSSNLTWAQKSKPRRNDSLYCGTPVLPEAQQQAIERQIQYVLAIKKAAGEVKAGITYIPIRPHILQRSDGSGGMTLASLNNVLAKTNQYFLNNGSGIQFYFCGTAPDYVRNTTWYDGFPQDNQSVIASYDVGNALNVYFVNYFENTNLLGRSHFPENTIESTRSFMRTGGLSDDYIGNNIVSHELGHTFNLYHTHETVFGRELVTRGFGANCQTAGDLLCDTPADIEDPYGSNTQQVNGCDVYTGTAVDDSGTPYNPDVNNIMSYYLTCSPHFSQGQYERMQGGLAMHQSATAYNLGCAPTAVNTPTNVNISAPATGGITLSWQDNAGNEMGYIIERATSANGPFVPIGGVAPNRTYYKDLNVTSNTTYWYRVRPSNSTTNGISAVVATTAGRTFCQPTFSIGCGDEDGLNSFNINGVALSTESGCSPESKDAFPDSAPIVYAGQTVSVGGQFLGTQYPEKVKIWADLNRNGTYEASEVVYQSPGDVLAGFSGNLLIPAGIATGLLNIRVIVAYYNEASTDPCGGYAFGEAEDYVVTVGTAPDCGTMTTVKPGDWNDPGVWSCNRVPTSNDVVEIRHAVTVASNTTVLASGVKYTSDGRVVFGTGGQLRVGPVVP